MTHKHKSKLAHRVTALENRFNRQMARLHRELREHEVHNVHQRADSRMIPDVMMHDPAISPETPFGDFRH